jgi:glucoside 3-dehydrogenase (cytochrome c) hitch-hiker subunit
MSSSNEQETRLTIDRREALMRVTALLGGAALVGSSALWEACSRDSSVIQQGDPGTKVAFSPADVSFLDEVADTILPDTKTPGAKAAKVGAFMTVMVNDCYDEKDQKIFKEGLAKLDDASKKANGAAFMSATPAQRLSLLETIDKEAKTFMDTKAKDAPTHYFRMMKELTLLGYFTSQIGCTQAQRYIESPGRLDPCVPYKPGDRAWAGNA